MVIFGNVLMIVKINKIVVDDRTEGDAGGKNQENNYICIFFLHE